VLLLHQSLFMLENMGCTIDIVLNVFLSLYLKVIDFVTE